MEDEGLGCYYGGCTVIAYIIIVAVAFMTHPLLGFLFLWLAIYIAPIAGFLVAIALPFVILGAVLLFAAAN